MVSDIRKMILSKELTTTLIIIPAYNEALCIEDVIRDLRSLNFNVAVIDDGSTDETAVIAKLAGATVISHQVNKGYEEALQSGIDYARKSGYEYAITFDADGQHNPNDLEKVVKALKMGSRMVVGVRPKFQRIGEYLSALVTDFFWGIKDPLCGLKGYRLGALGDCGRFDTYKSVGTEVMFRIAKSGAPIKNVEIDIRKRNGQAKFGVGIRPNIKIIRALLLGVFKAKPFPNIENENGVNDL
jgi:glycosyltransferase involved in cell wall biosynthesis